MSSAYTQMLWSTLNNRSIQVSVADGAFSLLGNALGLLRPQVWRMNPLATLTALATWLLPISIVFAPASLTVTLTSQPRSAMLQVPSVDYTSMNFASLPLTGGPMPDGTLSLLNVSLYGYRGPQYVVSNLVAATAAQGILPIAAPEGALNVSWIHDSAAPSIRCSNASADMQAAITENLVDVFMLIDEESSQVGRFELAQSFGYIAWTPSAPGDISSSVPFVIDSSSWALRSASLGPEGVSNDSSATLYVATYPKLLQAISIMVDPSARPDLNTLGPYLVNSTVLQCQLYNISQHAEYTMSDGSQTVLVSSNHTYNSVPILSGLNGSVPMDNLGNLSSLVRDGAVETIDPTIMRTFSYQSVMDAFGSVLVGTIGVLMYGQGALQVVNTSIMSTFLSNAREIQFLRDYYINRPTGVPNLETAVLEGGYPFNGVSVTKASPASQPLAEAIEELFRNVTISLAASELLQANLSSPYRPIEVNVTFTPFVNTYSYSTATLWTAYGTALGIGLWGAVLGLLAIVHNKASFSNDFSTVLRATRLAKLSTDLKQSDTDGRDPLPGYLARARITLHSRRAQAASQDLSLEPLQPMYDSQQKGSNPSYHRTASTYSAISENDQQADAISSHRRSVTVRGEDDREMAGVPYSRPLSLDLSTFSEEPSQPRDHEL